MANNSCKTLLTS